MSAQVSHYFLGTMLVALIISLTVTITNARPNHFGDSNQVSFKLFIDIAALKVSDNVNRCNSDILWRTKLN